MTLRLHPLLLKRVYRTSHQPLRFFTECNFEVGCVQVFRLSRLLRHRESLGKSSSWFFAVSSQYLRAYADPKLEGLRSNVVGLEITRMRGTKLDG